MRLRYALAFLMVLGAGLDLLAVGCGAGGQEAQRIAEGAREAVNKYCDARAKALEALGAGEAGAAQ